MCLYSSRTASCVYILVLLRHLLAPKIVVIVKDNTVYCDNLNPICNRITIRERLKQSLALFPYIYVCNFAGQSIRKRESLSLLNYSWYQSGDLSLPVPILPCFNSFPCVLS
jgi:hypothetical protein